VHEDKGQRDKGWMMDGMTWHGMKAWL